MDHSQNVSTAWSFYGTSSGVRLCWELGEPKGPKGRLLTGPPRGERSGGFYRTIPGVLLYGGSKNLKDLKVKSLRSSYTGLCPQKRLGGVEMESRLN